MTRREKLFKIFENVDESKRDLVEPVLEEVVFLEEKLHDLKKFPFLRINPSNPAQQKITAAGKQYKELSQSYLNAIKVLSSILNRDIQEEDDEFDSFLKERRG